MVNHWVAFPDQLRDGNYQLCCTFLTCCREIDRPGLIISLKGLLRAVQLGDEVSSGCFQPPIRTEVGLAVSEPGPLRGVCPLYQLSTRAA